MTLSGRLPPRENESTILLYHGVTDSASEGIENFSRKHATIANFEEQIAWVAENTTPMPLREMATRLVKGDSLPPRSVAVTFDDTYRNNATVALPIQGPDRTATVAGGRAPPPRPMEPNAAAGEV